MKRILCTLIMLTGAAAFAQLPRFAADRILVQIKDEAKAASLTSCVAVTLPNSLNT